MAEITIAKTGAPMPTEAELVGVRRVLFECFRGFTEQDNKRWKRFWKTLINKEPGEMAEIAMVFPRSGPYHRRHMAIEQAVFDAQERFTDFEQFRYWLKVGAAWVTWAAGPSGGVVPIPKSISYAKADEEEFRLYHAKVVEFLRGPHAAKYLWKHLGEQGAAEMMDSVLQGFDE
jgi:hypothetical protein